MSNTAPTRIYVGRREDIIREVGGLSHIYEGKYLVAPDGCIQRIYATLVQS